MSDDKIQPAKFLSPKICRVCGLAHLRPAAPWKRSASCIRALAVVLSMLDTVIMEVPGGVQAMKRARSRMHVRVARLSREE